MSRSKLGNKKNTASLILALSFVELVIEFMCSRKESAIVENIFLAEIYEQLLDLVSRSIV